MTSMAEINAATGLRAKLQQERISGITSGATLAINSFLVLQNNILQMTEGILSLDEGKPSEDSKPKDDEKPKDAKPNPNPNNKNPKNNNNKKRNNIDGNGKKFSGNKRLPEKKPENKNLPKKNNPPKNFAREGARRREAFRQAKRDQNIPQGREPIIGPNKGRRGQTIPGKVYKLKDANNHEVIIRDDVEGHIFKDGGKLPKHFNVGDDHYFYE